MKELLRQVMHGTPLTFDQAEGVFTEMMSGTTDPVQTGAMLALLAVREPTVEELHAAATVLRRHVVAIDAPEDVVDTCGTGGVGSSLFNVSTTAAIVAAACGVPVAKHGNRAITSRSGSSDVLRALGVNIDTTPEQAAACLREAHICFAYAPRHHPAMKHVAAVRQALGFPTIFNYIGPLTNPARARRQVVGTRSAALAGKMLEVLVRLGAARVLVVVGHDPALGALCDISVSGETDVLEFDAAASQTRRYTLQPEDLGLQRREGVGDLVIGSVEASAAKVRAVLGVDGRGGERGAARDIVLANAAAALWVAGRTDSIRTGIPLVAQAIDSGAALRTLEHLAACSFSAPTV